jgi:thiol-disulfide isomerase/thioredoxin
MAQTTVVVPLAKQLNFNRSSLLNLDSTQRLRQVPKEVQRYMLKYIVMGGSPGQPPAQRLNFLIGRDKQNRIVFVPAEPGTLKLRRKDMQVLPATPGETSPQPFQVQLRGLRGPLTLDLRPKVYLPKGMTVTVPWKNDLFLLLDFSKDTYGLLQAGEKQVKIQAMLDGPGSLLAFNDEVAALKVLDGQHEDRLYHMGESFLTNGYLVTPRHISPNGDSLTVQLTKATAAPYGKDAGFAFRPATLTDVQGQPLSLAGTERPLVLDFWGTWCGPCVALTPALKTLHQQYATTADIVSVALDEPAKVTKYLQDNAIDWRNAAVPESQEKQSLIGQLDVKSYPTFLLVYKGQIQYRGVGEAGLQELTRRLAQLR